MHMKIHYKFLALSMMAVFLFGATLPANAFYIEIPQIFKNAITSIKTSNTSAQETSQLLPPPNFVPNQNFQQPTMDQEQQFSKPPMMEGQQQPQIQPQPPQPYNNQPMNFQPPQNQFQQKNQPPMMNQENGENEKNNQNEGGNKNYLQDVQRGAKQMERSLTQFDALLLNTEKTGQTVKSEIKEKANTLREMLEKAKAAKNSEDVQDFDMGEAGSIAQELEQYRRELQDQTQRLKQVKQQIRNAEQAVKTFEKQIIKAKDCVSPEVKTKLESLKTTIGTIKNAKTWDEVEAAGMEDMGEIFGDLNDSREQLEICARWPQILKQVDKQMKNLDKQLSKSKTLVAKLSSKGIDLSVPYNAFEAGIIKMKAVREEAMSKMKSGDAQGASELLQDDLFGQMEDIMQNQQTIQTMSNLGTFNSQFKRSVTDAQKQISMLKRKKMNTAELESILAEVKTKGAEITNLIKQKDADLDTIMSEMEDIQDLRLEFSDKMSELTGEDNSDLEKIMGPSQFKSIQMPSGMNQFIDQPKQTQSMKQDNSFNSQPALQIN